MSAYTLFLTPEKWDLTLDSGGGIAVTQDAYAIAQNVANAIRLFTNDAYYDSDKGIPHFVIELKTRPALSILRSRCKEAAEKVPGVKNAEVIDLKLNNRVLSGDIRLILNDGSIANVEI